MTWFGGFALDAAILVFAVVPDLLLPEPPSVIHPVVWFGRLTSAPMRVASNGSVSALLFGFDMVVAVVGTATVVAWIAISYLLHIHLASYVVIGAALLRPMFTVTGLSSAALQTRRELANG